jgi:hypothetical protein
VDKTPDPQATNETTEAPPQPEPSTPDTPIIDYEHIEPHPLTECLPANVYTPEEAHLPGNSLNVHTFETLKASIQEHGLLDKLWIYEAMLLDGRERMRASAELGMKLDATHFRTFTGTRDEALRFGIQINLTTRRQINYTQKVGGASKLANLEQGGGPAARSKLQSLGLTPVSMDEAAEIYGVSTSAISEFRKVTDPLLIKRMMDGGTFSLWDARRTMIDREEKAEQKAKARRQKKAGGSTGAKGGGDKKPTWDPNTSKATRAGAIQTLNEQGITNPTEETIERTIKGLREYEQAQAELHKQQQEQQTGAQPGGNGGGCGGNGAQPPGGGPQSIHADPPYTGEVEEPEHEEPEARPRKNWTGIYRGTGTFTAGRKGNGAKPPGGNGAAPPGSADEELTEARKAYQRGEQCQTLGAIYARFDELGIGGPHWADDVFVAEVLALIENLVLLIPELNKWGDEL